MCVCVCVTPAENTDSALFHLHGEKVFMLYRSREAVMEGEGVHALQEQGGGDGGRREAGTRLI